MGDLLFSGRIPTLDGSIVGWLKLIPELIGKSQARRVPGHGQSPWPDAILPVQLYLTVLATDVRKMIKDRKNLLEQSVATAAQSERIEWAPFRVGTIRATSQRPYRT
ncbi:hypothetical protein [Bradyrhizobium sp. RDI18]|uniref:hypothetical protein n=1 Tax=Bradyrhizobium sp. RDI18 TaxID=3367400 RepID=UPI0037153819